MRPNDDDMSFNEEDNGRPDPRLIIDDPNPLLIQLITLKGAVKLEKSGMERHGRSAKVIACELLGMSTRSKHETVIAEIERRLKEGK